MRETKLPSSVYRCTSLEGKLSGRSQAKPSHFMSLSVTSSYVVDLELFKYSERFIMYCSACVSSLVNCCDLHSHAGVSFLVEIS